MLSNATVLDYLWPIHTFTHPFKSPATEGWKLGSLVGSSRVVQPTNHPTILYTTTITLPYEAVLSLPLPTILRLKHNNCPNYCNHYRTATITKPTTTSPSSCNHHHHHHSSSHSHPPPSPSTLTHSFLLSTTHFIHIPHLLSLCPLLSHIYFSHIYIAISSFACSFLSLPVSFT